MASGNLYTGCIRGDLKALLLAIMLIILGMSMNYTVSSLNEGMPFPSIHSYPPAPYGKWIPIWEETRLLFLADIISTPWVYLSLGDICIIGGTGMCLFLIPWVGLNLQPKKELKLGLQESTDD